MKYISIGAVLHPSTEAIVTVTHYKNDFKLTGLQADLWLNGRFEFSNAATQEEIRTLEHLKRMGLVVIAENEPHAEYTVLTQCIIIGAKRTRPYWHLKAAERTMLKWILEAGLHLTAAELVWLFAHDVAPEDKYLGAENRQALVELIYTSENIQDNLLENEMLHDPHCDEVVKLILSLLKKKCILLI